MAKLIFKTKDRDESHKMLESVIASGEAPKAECREDHNAEGGLFFQVWDGPEVRIQEERAPVSAAPEVVMSNLSQNDLESLADLIAKKLTGGN